MTTLTKEQQEEAIRLYKDGTLVTNIAKKFELKRYEVDYFLFYIQKLKRPGKSRYSVDNNYFKIIDTPQKAYWLGFLYADGCVHENGTNLLLAPLDEDHLELYKKHINFTGRVERYYLKDEHKTHKHSIVRVRNKEFRQNLINKGCVERKTFKLTFPSSDIVPDKLISHFIRGYFDGDGSVWNSQSLNKQNNKVYAKIGVSITSSDRFIYSLQKLLQERFSIGSAISKHPDSKGISILSLSSQENILKFRKVIYKGAKVFLKRKREKYYSLKLDKIGPNVTIKCEKEVFEFLKANASLTVKTFHNAYRRYTKDTAGICLKRLADQGTLSRDRAGSGKEIRYKLALSNAN